MEKYVYILRDGNNNVVDVGESVKPTDRLYRKTRCRPSPGQGKFYGRTDITLEVVAGPIDRPSALKLEGELKLQYGLEWTEVKLRSLTMDQANDIRSKYIPRKYSQCKLASEYGVSQGTIASIINNIKYIE